MSSHKWHSDHGQAACLGKAAQNWATAAKPTWEGWSGPHRSLCWATARSVVWQRLLATSRLTQVSTACQPCSLGTPMRQAKVLALAKQKMFSRTAGHQTEQRLKYFLFLQSWKKNSPTVKRYTVFPELIWLF